jgi:outer membrane protein assembly factor BamB
MNYRIRLISCLIATCITIIVVVCAIASDWVGWRNDGTGISIEKAGIPLKWSLTENIRWSIKTDGLGWSQPVVTGKKLFITTATSDKQLAMNTSRVGNPKPNLGGGEVAPDALYQWVVYCLDADTGATLWKRIAAEKKPPYGTHVQNTFATETPVTDGERVYVYFGQIGLFCYDMAGNLVWSKDLGSYPTFGNWGTAASPALDNGRLFIQFDNEKNSFVVALNTKNGEELWRVNRNERSTWSSPIIWRNSLRTELIAMGGNYNISYDPATGKELWRCGSEYSVPAETSSRHKAAAGIKSSPATDKDMLYVGLSNMTGSTDQGPLWAIKAGGSGDISLNLKAGEKSNKWVAWYRDESGPHFTSPIAVNEKLYVFPTHEKDMLTCMNGKTGEIIYREKLTGSVGFYCSPTYYDGKIYCTDDNCTTFILDPGNKLKVLGLNSLNEMHWSTPAVANGAMYIRTTEHLYCIGTKK